MEFRIDHRKYNTWFEGVLLRNHHLSLLVRDDLIEAGIYAQCDLRIIPVLNDGASEEPFDGAETLVDLCAEEKGFDYSAFYQNGNILGVLSEYA